MIGGGVRGVLREVYDRAAIEDRRFEAMRIARRLSVAISREVEPGTGGPDWAWQYVERADRAWLEAFRRYQAWEIGRDQLVRASSALLAAWKAAGNQHRRTKRGKR